MRPPPDASLVGKRILVVEDQAIVALDLQATLEERGAVVVGPCHRMSGGLRAASDDPGLDAAILDVDLGEGNVFPLADQLAAGGVPFVFHTGYADLEALQQRYREAAVIRKPALPEEVAHKITEIISRRPSRY